MITISIPGSGNLNLEHLVLDYNGTIAIDGKLIPEVRKCLLALAPQIRLHVITADTFGNVGSFLDGISCHLEVIPRTGQDIRKRDYIRQLGAEHTVCVGNGRIDGLMLAESRLGIAVILKEGAAVSALLAADVVCTDIVSALGLLLNPLRLVATLRR